MTQKQRLTVAVLISLTLGLLAIGYTPRVLASNGTVAIVAQGGTLLVEWVQADPQYTRSYAMVLDTVRTALTNVTCTTAATTVCTSPLPAIDLAVRHTIQIIAVGELAEAASAPLPFGPPTAPQGVVVKKAL